MTTAFEGDAVWSGWRETSSGAPNGITSVSGQKLTTTDLTTGATARRHKIIPARGGDIFDFGVSVEVQSGAAAMWLDIDSIGANVFIHKFSDAAAGLQRVQKRVQIPWKYGNVAALFAVGTVTADIGVAVWQFPSINLVRGTCSEIRAPLGSSGAGVWSVEASSLAASPRAASISAVAQDATKITVTTLRTWSVARPPMIQMSTNTPYVVSWALGSTNTIEITFRDFAGNVVDPATVLSGKVHLVATF